ncbi:MAG: hypothetical protein IKZ66_03745 [Schwartzia sp.]|nr:hypothetical protein [Schwartzia sp. (in: firmicutes)]
MKKASGESRTEEKRRLREWTEEKRVSGRHGNGAAGRFREERSFRGIPKMAAATESGACAGLR